MVEDPHANRARGRVVMPARRGRLLAVDLRTLSTEPDAGQDTLTTALRRIGTFQGMEVGVWDAGPGTGVDIEIDEMFLVLSGRGLVTFDDGTVIDLYPGVLVRLHAGDRTTWTIGQRLRKLYLAAPAHHDPDRGSQ